MFKLMLLKLSARFCPLQKDWALVKTGTLHKQKKLRRFQTNSFRVTMLNLIRFFFKPNILLW